MKLTQTLLPAALAFFIALLASDSFPAGASTTEPLDDHWFFLKADAPGAEAGHFPDSSWRVVNVPHDWSIEGPFAETNPAGGAGAFLPSGVVWYRKHFPLHDVPSYQHVFVEFDGVMANSDVWINGFHLGHRPSGYVSFSYELTSHVQFGGDNVLAVRADTSEQPASRWYTGAGIYRHVRLVFAEPVHILENGVFIHTPDVSATQATVSVETSVTNATEASQVIAVRTRLLWPDGTILGTKDRKSVV